MTTDNREDYLISILRLTEGGTVAKTTELASVMGVSPASVSEMLKILSKDGLVEYAKYRGVKLTEDGLKEARLIRKRHHVMERFLIDILGFDSISAHEEACRIEHSISDEASVRLCNILGNVPDCDCQCCISPCKAVSASGIPITLQMSDMSVDEKGVISHLKSDDGSMLKKLISLGLIPGREITVSSKDEGVFTVSMNGSFIAVDSEIATAVYVDAVKSA
ncbi:MAG: metal-dependent transcriptional regulator [archaeon]|nr:metal-dependent transcriptional regulator [archaeon]